MFSLWKKREPENTFRLRNKGKIKVSEGVVSTIQSFCQDTDDKYEAGGVLIGRLIAGSKDIVIDKVTTPMIGDIRSRYKFTRGHNHQVVLNKEWVDSSGSFHYLGEWHTHPEDYPSPSRLDKNSWRGMLKTGVFSTRFLYFIIVGMQYYSVWEGDRRTLKFRRLGDHD